MTTPATTPAANNNLVAGIVAAVLGALAGAIAWAVIASVTNYKIGYAAVGVGALAGFLGGKVSGGSAQLPPIAAVIGVAGCFLGDLLIEAHAGAKILQVSSLSIFTDHTSELWDAYKYDFDFLSGVFYVFAGIAAFRLATQHAVAAQQSTTAPTYGPPTTETMTETTSMPTATAPPPAPWDQAPPNGGTPAG